MFKELKIMKTNILKNNTIMKSVINNVKEFGSRKLGLHRSGVSVTLGGASDEYPMSTRWAFISGRWKPAGNVQAFWKYAAMFVMLFTLGIGQMWGANIVIDLDLSNAATYPNDFPTATGTTSGSHTLGGYTFTFSCNTGYYKGAQNAYLMIGQCNTTEQTASIITFPAIANYKLTEVQLTTTSGSATALSLHIGTSFGSCIGGGDEWNYVLNTTKT